jgi:hypothetical protein
LFSFDPQTKRCIQLAMNRVLLSLVTLASATDLIDAFAQEQTQPSQPVAWAPSYVGSCGGCNLSGRNLTGWTLSGANYREANLEYAFMRGAQAKETNFEGNQATGADMRSAVLTSAKLVRCQPRERPFAGHSSIWRRIQAECSRRQPIFKEPCWSAPTSQPQILPLQPLKGADFSGANLTECRSERDDHDVRHFQWRQPDDDEV